MSRTVRTFPEWKYIRHPKTFQELKDSEGCRVDGIKKRKARAKKRLPSSYDDIPVAARKEVIDNFKKNPHPLQRSLRN